MKILKITLYWIMVAAIVTGAVYSYQKVQYGRKIAMLYQMATGNMAMGPGGGPQGGGEMGRGPGGGQVQMQQGQTGFQPSQMEQNTQGGQAPAMNAEGGQQQSQSGEGGTQGAPQMGQNTQGGQAPAMNAEGGQQQAQSGEGGMQGTPQMGQNMQGGRQGGFPGGRGGGPGGEGGPGGGKWYSISLRNVGPYTCLLAFFILATCVIDNGVKRFSRKKKACANNAA